MTGSSSVGQPSFFSSTRCTILKIIIIIIIIRNKSETMDLFLFFFSFDSTTDKKRRLLLVSSLLLLIRAVLGDVTSEFVAIESLYAFSGLLSIRF